MSEDGQNESYYKPPSQETSRPIGEIIFRGISVVQGLVVLAYVPSVAVGLGFGVSRRLERRGRRSEYPRIAGLRQFLDKSWKEVLVVAVIFVALAVGLTKGP